MNFGGPTFIIAIILISTIGWVLTSWIRAKHGYPLENEWTGITHKRDPEAQERVDRLQAENGALRDQVSRLEDRIAVLERIATDPAERTAREIDSLR